MLKSAPPRTDHTPGPLHPASAPGAQGRRFRLLRMPGLTLIALVGVLALWLAVAVPATGTVSAQAMDDATLSSLTLSDVDINACFRLRHHLLHRHRGAHRCGNDGNGNAHQPNATVVITLIGLKGGRTRTATVPLAVGENNHRDVVVTAEDGTTMVYAITVTRARYTRH